MDDLLKVAGGILIFVGMLFVLPLLGATFGAFGGWVVGLFWGETILGVLRALGFPATIKMWQLGCALGFISPFLRTKVDNSK